MTFPVERKHAEEAKLRISTVVQSAISHHAVFYAYMTFSSAHRAIISGEHSDLVVSGKSIDRQLSSPDYFSMKARSIALLNEMMKNDDQATSDAAFEAVMALLSTSVSVVVQAVEDS